MSNGRPMELRTRLPAALAERFEEACKRLDVSKYGALQQAVAEWCDRHALCSEEAGHLGHEPDAAPDSDGEPGKKGDPPVTPIF